MAEFSLTDDYHVHAYVALGFVCDDCDTRLSAESAHEPPSDEWCIDIADQAGTAGWRLPNRQPDG